MEERVRKLEQGHAVTVERIDGLEKRMDMRFDEMEKRMDTRFDEMEKRVDARFGEMEKQFVEQDKRFDSLERKIDGLPDEWAMARVVFYVIGMMMAAIILGQRLLGWLP